MQIKTYLLLGLFLTGCGFSPLYKKVQSEHSIPVQVAPIPDTYGYMMRQSILDRMGSPSEKNLYTLTVQAPTFSTSDQAIDNKNFSSIIQVNISTRYTLKNNKTNKVILNSSSSLSSSYGVVQDPYATTVAERKAKQELAKQLAEQVSTHVLSVLSGENL